MDRHYWVGAGRSILQNLRSTSGFGKNLVRDIANAGLRHDAKPKAPTVWIYTAFPELEGVEVDLGLIQFQVSNMDPNEQFLLGALAKARDPKRIFEIGTFDGSTTLLLARHAPRASVMTLDLPSEQAHIATVSGEIENAEFAGVGIKFSGTSEAKRIGQLYGDSRAFDFSPWYGTIDLVLVDAGHEYEYVRLDTDNAYRLLSPGGLIVWDDYALGWPGVVKAVDKAARNRPGRLIHIFNTECAIYEAPV